MQSAQAKSVTCAGDCNSYYVEKSDDVSYVWRSLMMAEVITIRITEVFS